MFKVENLLTTRDWENYMLDFTQKKKHFTYNTISFDINGLHIWFGSGISDENWISPRGLSVLPHISVSNLPEIFLAHSWCGESVKLNGRKPVMHSNSSVPKLQ